MSFQRAVLVLCGITSVLLIAQVESIRLCGRQLADLLNTICERNGGFHTPPTESTPSLKKRALIEVFRPFPRRTDPSAANEDSTDLLATSDDGEVEFTFQSGVVDECCKKPCSFPTLVSYCANAQQTGTIELDGILLPVNQEGENGALSEFDAQQISSSSVSSSSGGTNSNNANSDNRPNLGHSNRNRPVFIVLSQSQEEEDRSAGEYRL